MFYFQKTINGQPRSIKDVVFQILHFLPDEDLKNIYNTHYVLHPLLNKIPRTPFCYTIRTSLEFTFNCDQDFLLKIEEIPGEVIDYKSLNNPRVWYLLRSSIFTYVNFDFGRISVDPDVDDSLCLITYGILVCITAIIDRPISCYRLLFNERYLYPDNFKEDVGKHFLHVPIPLSDGL